MLFVRHANRKRILSYLWKLGSVAVAYIDDKLEQIQEDERKRAEEDSKVARATFLQLCNRYGTVGGLYWQIEKKTPPKLIVKPMLGPDEEWELEPNQVGNYKQKMYRKVK